MDTTAAYRGRFAPSPTGPLHLGSLVAALASWLDARAHDGKWLIRIEDIDPPREHRYAAQQQIEVLGQLAMHSDEPIVYQSGRTAAYEIALQQIRALGRAYYCRCSRGMRQRSGLDPTAAYPGTCRDRGLSGPPGAVRFLVDRAPLGFEDRACGRFEQDLARSVGDFVIRRADGLWAYQLAVVVDDAHQRITDVVRGADLLDNTPRQIALQRALDLPTPRYLHLPLVLDAAGRKLSKQTGAAAVQPGRALVELEQAWRHLGFAPSRARTVGEFQRHAIDRWRERWCQRAAPGRVPVTLELPDAP